MEKEKKGLFARLLDFWKGKIDGGGADGIGFWNEKKKMDGGTVGVDVSVRGAETKLFRQEEEVLTQEKKKIFTESENGRKRASEAAEDPTRTRKKSKTGMLTAEIFREERKEEGEKSGMGKAFFRDVEEREKSRTIIPVAEPAKETKETEIEEERPLYIEEKEKDEKRGEAQIDIEKLMRQMTKKLWEERESCGRRLR